MQPDAYAKTLIESKSGWCTRFVVVGLSASMVILTIVALPLANLQFGKISAVVPFQSAIVVVTDGMTALLLILQCSQLRQGGTLYLSGAYLFCGFIATAQFLTFPDIFSANLATPQVSPWLWTIWHFGFPLLILGYVVMINCYPDVSIRRFASATVLTVAGVALFVGALTVWLIWNHDVLPTYFRVGDGDMTKAMWRYWSLATNIAIIICAGAGLVMSRTRWNKLNLYLLLSLAASGCEVFCVIFLNSRYTLYWYFARFDGVVASSAVLVMFLIDNARLYRQLMDINRTLENRVTERTIQLSAALKEREQAIEDEMRSKAAWRESEERFRAAQEASLDGFVIYEPVFDREGRVGDLSVVYANPVAARYCLTTPQAMIGRPISESISGARTPGGMIERHASVLTTGQPLEYVLDYQADGIGGHFLNMVVPFGRYIAATFRDITGAVRQREELEAAKAAAEQANMAKSRFLASVSHDLRQPMMALRLLLHTVAFGATTPEQASILARIDETLGSTETMLSRLMDLAALELGKVPVKREVFRLDTHLAAIVDENSGLAESKGLLLRRWTTPCWTNSDPVLLGNIVRNLVVNAVRYTERGCVLVAIRRRGERLRIEVRDSGKGIPSDRQREIFEEFRQLENQERNRSKGQGLGLTIVALTAERLGHPLFLRSEVGRGSVFAIEVSSETAPGEGGTDVGATPHSSAEVSCAGILIVEDDPIQASALATILTRSGNHVTVANDGASAMAVAPQQLDLILTDYRLPGDATGLELIAELRRINGRQVPALLLTGDIQAAIVAEAGAAGCGILHKPCSPIAVIAAISRLISESRALSGGAVIPRTGSNPLPAPRSS